MGTRNPQCFLVWHLHTVKYFVHRRNGKIHFRIETEDLRQKMAFGLCMDTISSERNLLCESIDILFSKGHLKDTMPLLPDIEFSMSGSEATGARPKDFFAVGSLNARDVISRSGHFPFAKEARQHVSLPVRCSRELFISVLLIVDDAFAMRLCFKADEWPIQINIAIDWKCYSVVVCRKPQILITLSSFQRFNKL